MAAAFVLLAVVFGAVSLAAVEWARFGALTAIWPTNALALLVLLRAPQGRGAQIATVGAFAIAVGASVIHAGGDLGSAIFLVLINLVEIGLSAWLIRRARLDRRDLTQPEPLLVLLLAAGGVAPAVAAALAAPVVASVLGAPLLTVWWEFFTADALGAVLILPFGLVLTRAHLVRLGGRRDRLEAAGLLAAISCTAAYVFTVQNLPQLIWVSPLLIAATLRFGLLGAATSTIWTAFLSVGLSLAGYGPLGREGGDPHAEMIWLQSAMATLSLATLPVAAVLAQRDRAEAGLQEGRRVAEAASAAKSNLLANLSHEVRTPLNAMTNLSRIMLAGGVGPLNDEQKAMLDTVAGSADQLVALAADLTAFARAEAGELDSRVERLDLERAAERVIASMNEKVSGLGVAVTLLSPADWSPKATANLDAAERVIQELLNNALDHAGGEPVEIAFSRPGLETVRIEVRDHGPGVPENRRDGLFEPFNRFGKLDGRYTGTGVGLALARRLAQLQGGDVDFESAPGQGSVFWLDLPA